MESSYNLIFARLTPGGEIDDSGLSCNDCLYHLSVRSLDSADKCSAVSDYFYTYDELLWLKDSQTWNAYGYVNIDYDPGTQYVDYHIYNMSEVSSRAYFIENYIRCFKNPVDFSILLRVYDSYIYRFVQLRDSDLLAVLSGIYGDNPALLKSFKLLKKEPYVLYAIPTNYLNAFMTEYSVVSGVSLYDSVMYLMTPKNKEIWLRSDFIRSDHPLISSLASSLNLSDEQVQTIFKSALLSMIHYYTPSGS